MSSQPVLVRLVNHTKEFSEKKFQTIKKYFELFLAHSFDEFFFAVYVLFSKQKKLKH